MYLQLNLTDRRSSENTYNTQHTVRNFTIKMYTIHGGVRWSQIMMKDSCVTKWLEGESRPADNQHHTTQRNFPHTTVTSHSCKPYFYGSQFRASYGVHYM